MISPLSLVLMLAAAVLSESVRETETWVPMSTTQTGGADPDASGDSPAGSDFGFTDDDDEGDDYEISGSGAGGTESPARDSRPSPKPDADADNRIPDLRRPVRPTVDETDLVQNRNDIPPLRTGPGPRDQNPSNVLMSQATGDAVFNNTKVLAAGIVGCAVFLVCAVLLILLLVYRMKKKDEGSYDLGKKPIYKKAPTTEIYA